MVVDHRDGVDRLDLGAALFHTRESRGDRFVDVGMDDFGAHPPADRTARIAEDDAGGITFFGCQVCDQRVGDGRGQFVEQFGAVVGIEIVERLGDRSGAEVVDQVALRPRAEVVEDVDGYVLG